MRVTTIPLSLDKLLTGQLKFMSDKGFDVTAVSANGSEIESIKEREDCEHCIIPMTRTISPLADVKALWKMVRLIKKEKPVIVHTHTPKAGLIGMLAAWFCKVPVRLHTVAGLPLMESSGSKRKLLVFIEKCIYACASAVYPNSFELKDYIEKNKFTSFNKLKVIGKGSSNGIDIDYFKKTGKIITEAEQIRAQYRISANDLVFVFVGRIVKDKGINELVKAFDHLNKKYFNIKLLLIGPFEDDLDPIDNSTRDILTANRSIICTGFINDVRPYLAAADVLAFPSYREGFPNVPLQAGCFDLPSIVSNINGCNEIIKNNVNGLIVPPKNLIALEAAMERMVADEDFRKKCSSVAREMITKNFSREVVWHALLEEYKRELNQKGIKCAYVSEVC